MCKLIEDRISSLLLGLAAKAKTTKREIIAGIDLNKALHQRKEQLKSRKKSNLRINEWN